MKAFILLLIPTFLILTSEQNLRLAASLSKNDSTLDILTKKKAAIDKYLKEHLKDVSLYAKVPGKKELIKVRKGKWPDEVEYSYNVLKDTTGKIIYIMQSPFSESGDWNIEYKHYFDDQGNTLAFTEDQSIFNDEIKGGVVREERINYYQNNFKLSSSLSKIMDKDWKIVKRKRDEFDFHNYQHSIYRNLSDCLKGYNIKYN